jgi:hypothetical protein
MAAGWSSRYEVEAVKCAAVDEQCAPNQEAGVRWLGIEYFGPAWPNDMLGPLGHCSQRGRGRELDSLLTGSFDWSFTGWLREGEHNRIITQVAVEEIADGMGDKTPGREGDSSRDWCCRAGMRLCQSSLGA